jgi:L-iditol 2-dehydrogenase
MRAAVTYGPRDTRVELVPEPSPASGEVVVEVEACGICGGDYSRHQAEIERSDRLQKPVISGHEVAGTVIKCGLESEGLPIGSRVAVSPNQPCRRCPICRKGNTHLCPNRGAGELSTGGGFAEQIRVLSEQCYFLPEAVSLVEATVVEPLACCLHSMSRISVKQGESVAIIGGGVNAQLFVQLAQLSGARQVILIDSLDSRLRMAMALGADEVIDISSGELEGVHRAFPGGADVVINTRGAAEYTRHAIELCAVGGRILFYGVARVGETVPIEPHLIWRKEIQLVGGRSFNTTFGAALSLISSRRVHVGSLVTRSVNLEGYAEIVALPARGHIKTVVVPQQANKEEQRPQDRNSG